MKYLLSLIAICFTLICQAQSGETYTTEVFSEDSIVYVQTTTVDVVEADVQKIQAAIAAFDRQIAALEAKRNELEASRSVMMMILGKVQQEKSKIDEN